MMHLIRFQILALLLISMGCSTGPRPVTYGTDQCAHCDMTVMDQRYGAELITAKGKVYVFDSIECLLDYLEKGLKEGEEAEHLLVTSYTVPGNLIDATGAWYIHTKALPSPMGMYLTAFENEYEVRAVKNENGGMIFTWEELLKEYKYLTPSLLH